MLSPRPKYSTRIKSVDNADLELFGTRLIGRIIVAGLALYTEKSIDEIRHILSNIRYNGGFPIDDEQTNTNMHYLRNSFFLANLNRHTSSMLFNKRKVLNALSDFEKEYLQTWWLKFSTYELPNTQYLDSKQISWLEQKIKPLTSL